MAKRSKTAPVKKPADGSTTGGPAENPTRTGGRRKTAGTPLAWTFPKNSLEDSIRLAQAIEEKNAGRPLQADQLCKVVGFSSAQDWRFLDLLRSANQYSLVEGSGAKATVELTSTGADVVAPSSAQQRLGALFKAFLAVDQFRSVYDFYKGKRLPEDEFFGNTLVRNFSVPKERVETFIQLFRANLEFLRIFSKDEGGQIVVAAGIEAAAEQPANEVAATIEHSGRKPLGRTYIDSCFVLMPFGDYFDRYFDEIYTPACQEAGFEPIRADGLFSTGSVMEQIWDQINRAKVLLAELTGKNANVFYELGLAHACRKPVVFVTANLDDVPFDLRHLRVVEYNVRNPGWDTKLRQDITTYLRNARSEPHRSIPQPFRGNDGGMRVAD